MTKGSIRILIADDSAVSRAVVTKALDRDDREMVVVENGVDAAAVLESEWAPGTVAVLDWEMPGLTGPELCRRVRAWEEPRSPYLILLTSRDDMSDTLEGLSAGADDYLTKPFHESELQARVRVGERVVELQRRLSDRVAELEEALARVARLEGLLPICSYCKKIRDDDNYWHQVEAYVTARSGAKFSHGVCPECFAEHLQPYMDE